MFFKIDALKNFVIFTRKRLCQSLFFKKPESCNYIKTETLEWVFSCEFCKIFKNTFFYRTPPVAACKRSRANETRISLVKSRNDKNKLNKRKNYLSAKFFNKANTVLAISVLIPSTTLFHNLTAAAANASAAAFILSINFFKPL